MKEHYPLVIIGAGPAGISAASVAAEHGLQVALLDEQASPGGQIFRSIESISDERIQKLGADYQRGQKLVADFRDSGVEYFPQTSVWSLNQKREIGLLQEKTARIISADQVLIANGAMERPLPFTGWVLPGVVNAGGGQILFKQSGIIPEDGVVMAGSGPSTVITRLAIPARRGEDPRDTGYFTGTQPATCPAAFTARIDSPPLHYARAVLSERYQTRRHPNHQGRNPALC